ncbi:MAG: NADH-quinone oxidoreductase subunit D [Candidatus Freyarchaeota archaeon]
MLEGVKGVVNPLKAIINLLASKPMTYNFPPETPLSDEFRGRHLFNPETCKGCSLCARVCPNNAIEMVERERNGEKVLQPQVDYQKCCFCGLCVDACPTGSLQFTKFPFILTMDRNSLVYPPEKLAQPPELEHPEKPKIGKIVDWARSRSIWVINFFTGCGFIEAIPWVSSGFDMERFGLIAVGSARHADAIIVGGFVTPKTLKRIIRIYNQMPPPKWVLAFGNCPMSGGCYWDSYNTIKHLDDYIPVDIWIAGCPPRPEPIGVAVVHAIYAIQNGYRGKEERSKGPRVPEIVKIECEEEGEVVIPFGPQHPASGNFHLGLKTDGEVVREAVPYAGYLHRGFEKLMEYRTWLQNIMLVSRICVLDGASLELAYAGAVEAVAGIHPPKRARYLRVIQAELSRIQSHLLNLGLITNAAGLDAGARIAWGDRERILALLERMTGARIYSIFTVPGGVRGDVKPSVIELARKTVKEMRKRLKLYDDLFFNNGVFIKRTKGVGVFSKDDAAEYDLVGPNMRACGVDFDVRKNSPYDAYPDLEFEVPTAQEGDAYHRMLCRRREIEESLGIVEQVLEKLPEGEVRDGKMKNGKVLKFFSAVPEGEAIHCVESARGELCFHMVSDGSKNPYRVHIKGPSFDTILTFLPRLLEGVTIADVPVIYWSLDNCPADHDR